MLYLERIPAAPLAGFVRTFWYANVRQTTHRRERVLPSGSVQVILNLERDFLFDCSDGAPERPLPPALIVGARSIYEIIDSSDMADLIGISFEPGGFAAFASDAVDQFSNRSVGLEDVWGAPVRAVRGRLREIHEPHARMRCLENFLVERFSARLDRRSPLRHDAVKFALRKFAQAPCISTVNEVAQSTGWSERRFSQVFREQVGLSPKVWCRIKRFQRAVHQLHAGVDIPWSRLALDCGFYDQSHLANEFRAFSGIDATTYSTFGRTPWPNHVPVE